MKPNPDFREYYKIFSLITKGALCLSLLFLVIWRTLVFFSGDNFLSRNMGHALNFLVFSIALCFYAIVSSICLIICNFFVKCEKWKYLSIVAVCSLLILPILCTIYNPFTERFRYQTSYAGKSSYRLNNLRNTMLEYSEHNNNRFPSAEKWCDLLIRNSEYLSEFDFLIFHHEYSCNVAFNKNLGGLKLSEVAGNTVLLFTANGDRNLNGDYDLMKTYQREQEQYAYLCLVNGRIVRYRLSDGTLFEIRPPSNEAFWIESEDDINTVVWKP